MRITKFESVVQRYFEKAYVSMLKKGADYESLDSTPSYILVDKKRATYYLSESDSNESSSNQDIAQINNRLIKVLANSVLADPIARLIYTYNHLPSDFTLSEIDIDQLSKKAALIISRDYSDNLEEFFSSINVYFTPVHIKAGYSIHFIDELNMSVLSEMFLFDNNIPNQDPAYSQNDPDNALEEEIDTTDPQDQLSDTLAEDITSEDIVTENTLGEPLTENILPDNAVLDDGLFDNIDTGTDIDLDNILSDLPPLDDDDIFQMELENSSTQSTAQTALDDDLDNYYRNKTSNDENNSSLPKIKSKKNSSLFLNLLALIFILPAYLLNKISLGKLPPFLIYWFTMLAIFFGLYEIPASHIVEQYYSLVSSRVNENIIQITDTSAIIVTSLSFTQSIEPKTAAELLSNPIISSVGFVTSVSTFLIEYQFSELFGNLMILRYALAFSALLMIISYFRLFGLRLYGSFILFFLTIPFILLLQSEILLLISDNISFLIANAMANPPSGLYMLQSLFSILTVFVLPILIFLIYFTFFAIIVHDNKHRGVLP